MSPIVDSGLLIAHVGGTNGGALRAFDPATGATKWSWPGEGGTDSPSYATPVVLVAGGVRQIVAVTKRTVVGVDAATGALLWSLPLVTPYDQNAVTPVVAGDMVIVSGAGSVDVRGASGAWRRRQVDGGQGVGRQGVPDVHELAGRGRRHLYGLTSRNKGQFFALDAKTGATRWTSPPRQTESASITAAGGRLWCLTTDGELVVLKADPSGLRRGRPGRRRAERHLGLAGAARAADPGQGRGAPAARPHRLSVGLSSTGKLPAAAARKCGIP